MSGMPSLFVKNTPRALIDLTTASNWLRFPPQLKTFQTLIFSSLSYAEISTKLIQVN